MYYIESIDNRRCRPFSLTSLSLTRLRCVEDSVGRQTPHTQSSDGINRRAVRLGAVFRLRLRIRVSKYEASRQGKD
jgi:hypothetical protein